MDCRMVFSSDGKYLYAEDVQNPLIDCFADGDFLQSIKDYYVISSVVVKLMESLANEGMVLDLSDADGEQTLSLDELKRQVKNQIASQI
jgi:hypothetical protein